MPLRLLEENVGAFFNDIDFTSLSKSFQDAIIITRMLGIQYLWIDSLCIIQDSRLDWQRESVTMARVYENSWCNIMATQAEDGRGGCFSNQISQNIAPFTSQFGMSGRTYEFWTEEAWNGNISNSKLLSRAWVVQERVLSQRLLHFAKDQMFWECSEVRACESIPNGITGQEPKPGLNQIGLQPGQGVYAAQFNTRYTFWKQLVALYSVCALTKPEQDKLVAISGIARKIGEPEEYLAGLWRQNLPLDLLWGVQEEEEEEEKKETAPLLPSTYRAPSWSWAKLDKEVDWEHQANDQPGPVEILEASTTPLTDDRFGQVRAGFLRLSAPLAKVAVEQDEFMWGDINGLPAKILHDTGEVIEECTRYCLLVSVIRRYKVKGIFLEPAGQKGLYRRCGLFSITVLENDLEQERLRRLFSSPSNSITAADVEEDIGIHEPTRLHRYVVTLI